MSYYVGNAYAQRDAEYDRDYCEHERISLLKESMVEDWESGYELMGLKGSMAQKVYGSLSMAASEMVHVYDKQLKMK